MYKSWQSFLSGLPFAAFALAFGTNAGAQTASGCATLASERVNLPQGAAAFHTTGAVPLRSGETLQLRMRSPNGSAARGSIALIEGGETGSPILAGAAPQEAAFAVPFDGLYGLEFRTDGQAEVTFEIRCAASSASLNPSASPQAFVERRTGRLLADESSQTSLRRRAAKPETLDKAVKNTAVLDEDKQPVDVSVSTSVQDLAAAGGQNFADEKLDFWVEGSVSQFKQKLDDGNGRYDAQGNAGSFNLGTDYLITPDLMIGALLQLDRYREEYDTLDSSSDSTGVLFGPYASVRLAPDLIFDAQMAWGDTDNESELPDGTRLSYETGRQLLRGQLSGNRSLLGLQFTPTVALSVVEDRFANPERLPENGTGADSTVFGRLGVGSAVSYRLALEDGGFLQPSAALSKGWDLDGLDELGIDSGAFTNETGAKAEAGLTLGTTDGVSIQASGAIEGLGEEDYSAWSGLLSLTAPLN